ncbi:MAG: hypothetical protein ND807_03730, partial [Vicinamibacterales bacterium]|nr:hypothetical protein [Vicinamibacterales bacterium]
MTAVVRDAGAGTWRLFENPREVLVAQRVDEVMPALRRVEAACRDRGLHAAGFISYEAASGFDTALQTKPRDPADTFPLLWFGLYEEPEKRG